MSIQKASEALKNISGEGADASPPRYAPSSEAIVNVPPVGWTIVTRASLRCPASTWAETETTTSR